MDDKEFNDLIERRKHYANIVTRLTAIRNYGTCPHCQQEMPSRVDIDTMIADAQKKLNEIMPVLDVEGQVQMKKDKIASEKRRKREDAFEITAKNMLIARKKDFKRVFDECKTGKLIVLPDIIFENRSIWNRAMEMYLNSPSRGDFEDEEELFFDLKIRQYPRQGRK